MKKPETKIYVAGHGGMVGGALIRALLAQGWEAGQIITKTHAELDLCDQQAVKDFFAKQRPAYVYMAAARVGGVYANQTYPASFIYDNLMMQANVIQAAHQNGVQRLMYLGSNCMYPRHAEQPMTEAALLTGTVEPTNEPYAIAKIAGLKLCESYNRQYGCDYRSVVPASLYGPGDNYHPENGHVIPALIRRFHEAKLNDISEVSIWGSGNPRREFMFVDDMAAACIFVMSLDEATYRSKTHPMISHINVGFGSDVTIAELTKEVCQAVGYKGRIVFDLSKPDGSPRKWIDSGLLNSLGWSPAMSLQQGLALAYADFLRVHIPNSRKLVE